MPKTCIVIVFMEIFLRLLDFIYPKKIFKIYLNEVINIVSKFLHAYNNFISSSVLTKFCL